MSIVLDVVQKMVLHGVYEFTCSAAFQVLRRQPSVKAKQLEKAQVLVEEVDECEELKADTLSLSGASKDADQLQREVNQIHKESEVIRPVSLLDVTRRSSGPIYPPKTSCMRIARNSYFS